MHTTRTEKSIGHENTFGHDLVDPVEIRRELLRLSNNVAVRLRKAGLVGRTVTLKLRYGDFRTVTRSRTLGEPTDVARRIYDEASDALAELIGDGERVRLIGVRAEHLRVSGTGAMLWDPDEEWRDAERTIDEVTAKFGTGAVRPATLVDRPANAVPSRPRTRSRRRRPRGRRRGLGVVARGIARVAWPAWLNSYWNSRRPSQASE